MPPVVTLSYGCHGGADHFPGTNFSAGRVAGGRRGGRDCREGACKAGGYGATVAGVRASREVTALWSAGSAAATGATTSGVTPSPSTRRSRGPASNRALVITIAEPSDSSASLPTLAQPAVVWPKSR